MSRQVKKRKSAETEPVKPRSAGRKVKKESGSGGLLSLIKDPGWRDALKAEESLPYFTEMQKLVLADYEDPEKEIFPPKELVFNALNLTPLAKLKAVIIGQDPYHDNGQAHGLSFSVPRGVGTPPSLKNIYKELQLEGYQTPEHGCLVDWAKRGVLLLNATLTVEAHKPNSHSKYGWQTFTDAIIRVINSETTGVVFILWGGFAHKKEKLIDQTKHGVVKSAHPSPLSVTKFLNSNCFRAANTVLVGRNEQHDL